VHCLKKGRGRCLPFIDNKYFIYKYFKGLFKGNGEEEFIVLEESTKIK